MPIDEENVRETIEMSQDSFPLVVDGLRIFLLGLVASIFILGIIIGLLPIIPKMSNVLVMNPVANTIVKIIVWCLAGFALLGIVCIFYKPIRLTTFIIFAVYLLIFVVLAEFNDAYKRLDWHFHQDSQPESRECVITLRKASGNGGAYRGDALEDFHPGVKYHQMTFYLTVKFTDTGEEYEFSDTNTPMPFFDTVREGDTVEAKIIKGTLKLQYIVGFETLE